MKKNAFFFLFAFCLLLFPTLLALSYLLYLSNTARAVLIALGVISGIASVQFLSLS